MKNPRAPSPPCSRLKGLDLARGLAVVGMVLVNYVYVFSHDLIRTLEEIPSTFGDLSLPAQGVVGFVLMGLAGRSAAVFLVLFGMGMSLQTRKEGRSPELVSRYLLLIFVGLAFIPVWEADILHFIGLYGLLALPLARLRTRWLLVLTLGLLAGAELLRLIFDYQSGWQPGGIGSHYVDMWSLTGQIRQLFFNGYHPVFPWLGFAIFGLVLGRLDLHNPSILKKLTLAGITAAIAGFLVQSQGVPAGFFPADTLFILLGMANATWVVALCLLACQKGELPVRNNRLNLVLRRQGRLALTHYPGHIWLGIIPLLVLRNERMDLAFEWSFGLALLYLLISGGAGYFWLESHGQGPLEKALRQSAAGLSSRWYRRNALTEDSGKGSSPPFS